MTNNLLIIALIISILATTLYFLFKRDENTQDDDDEDVFSQEYLADGVKERVNELTDTSHINYSLSKEASKKEEAIKLELIKARSNCGYGDLNSKIFFKDNIKRILQRDFGINESNINRVIPFDNENLLNSQDKFDILLYHSGRKYGLDAFYEIMKQNNFDELKGKGTQDDEKHYEVTVEDIDHLFSRTNPSLEYIDKINIVTQRIYSMHEGNGPIDALCDMNKLDGISAGLSGRQNVSYDYMEEYMIGSRNEIEYYYDNISCMFQGKTIRLSFLSFGTEEEMIRVVKKIYRYDDPGYLSEDRGYIISSMCDGSRVVVIRPKAGENWAFFIRKLNSIQNISIENLITDQGAEKAITAMRWIVKSCSNIAVTGKQFSGKTTLIKSLVEFVNPQFNIGVQEMIFELHLKNIPRYKNRNVMTLRDTNTITPQEILDLFKKMDRDMYFFGEVHSPNACSLVIQGGMAGTRQIILTHHAKTTPYLIDSFKIALQITGLFPSEISTAEEQVAKVLNFDFHMNTTFDGHIYLQRITEIIPNDKEELSGTLDDFIKAFIKSKMSKCRYTVKDIIIFQDNRYQIVGTPSKATRDRLAEYVTKEELNEFDIFFNGGTAC